MNASLAETIRNVLAQFPAVKLGYLFGSQVSGDTGPLSDVDIAVYLDESNASRRFKTELELAAALSRALRRNDVDVVVLNDASRPALKYHVIADGELIHEVEPYKLIVEPKIFNEYFDFHDSLKQHNLLGVRI